LEKYGVKMKKMALLLATDDWKKMEIYQKFLLENQMAVWRIKSPYTEKWVNNIQFPVNLYFYYQSHIGYSSTCRKIIRANSYPLSEVPPEYHSDKKRYVTFLRLNNLKKIREEIHISKFPKWINPNDYFKRGNQGIFRVVDIFEGK